MRLTNDLATRLANLNIIRDVYPMIDYIDVEAVWDEDTVYPAYVINMKIYLNDPQITEKNMYDKKFDPHYLIDKYYINLLKLAGIKKRNIDQFYFLIFNPQGEMIHNY